MNAITPTRPVLNPTTFDQLLRFSEFAAQSDLMPRDYKGKPANIFLAVQMGSELGLSPMQALNSISVINGRPGVWGDGLIGICRQSPLCQDIQENIEGEGDARAATCIATRRGSSPCIARFSVADAKKAGLWNKQGPWQQYPERMLQNRARGFALRDAFPDLLRGLKTVEELRDIPSEPREIRAERVQPDTQRIAAPERVRDAADDDAIPMLEAPVEDKLAVATDRLVARVMACETEEDLHEISRDRKISDWRTKIGTSRPELETRIADALGARYEALTADRVEAMLEEPAEAAV